MIILKVTKNWHFTFSFEDTIFEKPQGGEGGQIDLPPAVLGLTFTIMIYQLIRLRYISSFACKFTYAGTYKFIRVLG